MRAAVRARSRLFAQTEGLQRFPYERANETEPERTPNLAILATESVADNDRGKPADLVARLPQKLHRSRRLSVDES
jgi:hypothetical protein